jgi:hypothetical protein
MVTFDFAGYHHVLMDPKVSAFRALALVSLPHAPIQSQVHPMGLYQDCSVDGHILTAWSNCDELHFCGSGKHNPEHF